MTPPNPPNRTLVNDDTECPSFLWKAETPVQIFRPLLAEIEPVEIHVIPEGSDPTFCFVMETPSGVCVAAQISFDKLWPAMEAAIRSREETT